MCFVNQVNETPEAGPAGIMYELYYLNYCTITSTKSFICKSCTVQLGQVETRKNALKCFCMKHFCSNSRLACPRSDCISLSCIFAIVSFYCTIIPPSHRGGPSAWESRVSERELRLGGKPACGTVFDYLVSVQCSLP
jgi:hypothetical protein